MSENVLNIEKLSTRQLKALASLAGGASKPAAAAACGVTTRTIDRWLLDSVFSTELTRRSSFAIKAAAVRFAAMLDQAADVMEAAMTKPERLTGVKLRAANSVVLNAPRLTEVADLVERIEKLEAKI